MKKTDMHQFVNTACLRPGKSSPEVCTAAAVFRKLQFCQQCLLVSILTFASLNLAAQDASSPVVAQGVVVNDNGEVATALTLDFWLEQKNLGSTATADNGAFEIKLALNSQPADTLIRVTSKIGHAGFTVAQAGAGNIELRLQSDSDNAGMPIWLRTFFSIILPIVVLAIVLLAIRNRKHANSDV